MLFHLLNSSSGCAAGSFVLCQTKNELCGADAEAQQKIDDLMKRAKTDKKVGREIGQMRQAGRIVTVQRWASCIHIDWL